MKNKILKKSISHITIVTILIIVMPLSIVASVIANFINNGAPTATVGSSSTDTLVLDITIPDAWNGAAATADILMKAGSSQSWFRDDLNPFPVLGGITSVGYKEDGTAGFQGTEAVVRDFDADSVYTTAADIIYIDNADTPAAGERINNVTTANNVCSDNTDLALSTCVYTDSDATPCDATTGGETYYLSAACTAATDTEILTGDNWAITDNIIDATTDFIKENVAEELTYSTSADTNVYSTGGLSAGDALTNFPADCDSGGAGTQACRYTGPTPISSTDNIYIDEGTAAGATPNGVVDKQEDQLIGIGVQNTKTAVDTTDIAAVKVWADDGAAGFQGSGTDTNLGTMTIHSTNNKEWRLGSLTQNIAAGGLRIFVTVDIATTPTNGRTITFQIPRFRDMGGDGIVSQDSDAGIFVPSTNSGPTDRFIMNPSTQTIDGLAPTLSSFRSTTADDTYGPGSAINITANYDSTLGAGSTMDITLNNGATTTLNNVSGVTVEGTYTVGGTGSGEDIADLTVTSIDSESIADIYGNTQTSSAVPGAPANLGDAKNIVIDTTGQTVTSVDSPQVDKTYKLGEGITFQITYSQSVTVNTSAGTPTLDLNSGGTANYSSGSGGTTLTFTYVIGTGENSSDLDYTSTTALALNSGTIIDILNNNTNNTLPAVGTFAAAHNIVVSTTSEGGPLGGGGSSPSPPPPNTTVPIVEDPITPTEDSEEETESETVITEITIITDTIPEEIPIPTDEPISEEPITKKTAITPTPAPIYYYPPPDFPLYIEEVAPEEEEETTDKTLTGGFGIQLPVTGKKIVTALNLDCEITTFQSKYGITVIDGIKDTDQDGLADLLECEANTDPHNPDSDFDGLNDNEEVLDLKTDPNKKDEIIPKILITQPLSLQKVVDKAPLIKGIAPANSEVIIEIEEIIPAETTHASTIIFIPQVTFAAENENINTEKIPEKKKVARKKIGSTTVSENGVFLVEPEEELKDGKYNLIATVKNDQGEILLESEPVKIEIDSTINIKHPNITDFEDQKITEEILLNDIRIEIVNQIPTIKGTTNLGNKTTATWKSAVFSSAVVADLISGDFAMKSPQKLEPGVHEVYVTAHRLQDNTLSKTIKLNFLVKEVIEETLQKQPGQPQYWYLWILLAILAAGSGGFYILRKKTHA